MSHSKKMPARLQSYIVKKNKPPSPSIVRMMEKRQLLLDKVLFLNHKKKECGVYQYGKRLWGILKNCNRISYDYREIENEKEYKEFINTVAYKAIIYNYHVATMPWLSRKTIDTTRNNIGILHECDNHLFNKGISIDPTIQETTTLFRIPRPTIETMPMSKTCETDLFTQFVNFHENDTPIFGSFGFGFDNKGFPKIVRMINEQYDKAIIKFVIPHAVFDPNPNTVQNVYTQCLEQNIKKDIVLMIHTEFVSEHDLLNFLRSNTMNIFLYDNLHGRGISSTIDYALSVRKPLGISDSFMFRHIYSDEICLYKNSIQKCMENSLAYCEKFLSLYSHKNMIDKFHHIIHSP